MYFGESNKLIKPSNLLLQEVQNDPENVLLYLPYLFFFSTLGFATETIFSFSFDTSDLLFEKLQGYDRIKLVGGRFSAEPGSPLLRTRFVQVATPTELEVQGIEVVSFVSDELLRTHEIYDVSYQISFS